MPIVPEATLKSYFEDGKEPDEGKYINFIDSILLADGTRIVSGDFTVGDGIGSRYINIDGAAGAWRGLAYQTGGVNRWILRATNAAETGGNQGTDFEITSRTATGAWLGTPFKIWRATGTIKLSGADIYTLPWTNYTGLSTVVGFTSPTHYIHYKKVGKLVFVNYYLSGTGSGYAVTFTVPFAATAAVNAFQNPPAFIMDNSVALTTSSRARLPVSSAIVTVYKDASTSVWTPGGTRMAIGQFLYEAA